MWFKGIFQILLNVRFILYSAKDIKQKGKKRQGKKFCFLERVMHRVVIRS